MTKFVKGNEAVVMGALYAGCELYFGYPITPASEIAHGAAKWFPMLGRTFVQAECETASVNMMFGAAADEIVGCCFGTMKDHALWAWYCRHFDAGRIVDKAHEYASMQRQGEVRDAVTAFQAWLKKEYGKGAL